MKARRLGFLAVGAVLLVLTGFSAQSDARVNVNIGINIPAYTFAAPPPLVVIPGTYVYGVPDIDLEILFYHGYWYRPYEGRWYRARYYNGPWAFLAPARVPSVLIGLPPDYYYRHIPAGHRRIPYGEFTRNWRQWERNRYWERDEAWRHGRHEGPRDERHGEHRDGGRRD
jgi:hypothetical protein